MSEIDDILNGAPDHTPGANSAKKPASAGVSEVDDALNSAPTAARGFKGWAQDVGATALKGAIGVPEAAVGLADIVSGGAAGKFLENEGGTFGFRPKQAKEFANSLHSDATLEAQRKVQEADGIGGKFVAAIENPSVIATSIGESLPSMGAGGLAARGLMTATRLGQMGAKGAAIAGGLGEGITGAGSQAEQIRQETDDGRLTGQQAAFAGLTGAATTAFGVAGGKIANKLGIGDADTMIAQGAASLRTPIAEQAVKSIPKQVIQGAISEGLLEELPQSVSEQILQNLALGKDWTDGVDSAIVLGTLSGGVMGAGAAGLKGVSSRGGPNGDAAPASPALQLGNAPDPLISFPDGTVARQSEVDAYINSLPEQEQAAARAKMMGLAPKDGPAPDENPGLARVRQEFEARLGQLTQQEAGEPDVPQVEPPDGRAILDARDAQATAERDAAIAESRAVETPDDEILQSTGLVPRSVQMGLDPTAGPLSAGAAIAVDSGASDQAQEAAALEQAAKAAEKAPKTKGQSAQVVAEQEAVQAPAVDARQSRLSELLKEQDATTNVTKKAQLAKQINLLLDERAQPAISPPATQGEPTNGTETNQAQQASAEQPQAPASTAAQQPVIEQESPEAAARLAETQLTFKKAVGGEGWDGMDTAQRQELAAKSDLPKVIKANVHRAAWDTLNPTTRAKLEAAMAQPETSPNVQEATTAATNPPAVEAPEAGRNAAPRSTQPGTVEALRNVQDQPSAAAGSQTQAAPDQTPQAVGSNGVATRGETAGGSRGVEADGVGADGFDSEAFDKSRNKVVKASRAAGNKHLDEVPPSVESMRGYEIYYAHNTSERGVIDTVDNRGNVYVLQKDGNRFSLGKSDLMDYAFAKTARLDGKALNAMRKLSEKRAANEAKAEQESRLAKARAEVAEIEANAREMKPLLDRALAGTAEQKESAESYLDGQIDKDEFKAMMADASPGASDVQADGREVGATTQADGAKIAEAANQAATSQKNDLPEPTEAQKEAGNYKKGRARIAGHDISIENPAGSKRRPEWPALKNHYGYIKGSIGADKDHVDVFMTDRADDTSLPVFVVDQLNKDGSFDEHKIVMGAADDAEGRQTYLQNYEKGWPGLGAITQMTQDEFKAWVRDPAKTKKPVALKRGVLAKMGEQKRTDAIDRIAKGTAYFGTQEKADAFVSKSGIGDTHEVFKAKAGRFEVRAKVEAAPAPAVDTPRKGLGAQLAELNNELERQGAVQNANTRAKRDQIRRLIAAENFPDILKAVDDNIDAAEELNRAFQYAGDEPKAKTIERILKKRGITPEYQKRWTDRLLSGDAAPALTMKEQADQNNQRRMDETLKNLEKTTAPAAKPEPLTEQEKAAKAKMLNAAGKLAALLSKNTRASITPEQEQAMLPIVIELFEGAMDLGYVKFKQAARYVREFIAGAIDQDAADSIPIDTLQGAYIATSRRHKDKDITPKGEVVGIDSIAELEENADTDSKESENAKSDQSDPKALDSVPSEEDGGTTGRGSAGSGYSNGGETGKSGDPESDGVGLPAPRSGGSGSKRVSDPKTRKPGGKRSGKRGASSDGVGVPSQPPVGDLLSAPEETAETASIPNIPGANFKIDPSLNLGKGGEVAKFNDNIAAIRTLKAIEDDRRRATPDEQRILARFVGWGGLANAFPSPETGQFKPEWKKRGEELHGLLTPSEIRAASRSTRNAHFTSEVVVSGIWNAVRRLGYRNGLALESSVGSGNFLGLQPSDVSARFIGVEYDSITARLSAALYPQATVIHSGFQDVALPDKSFDLVIGNPPFGSESLRFQYKPELRGVSIHNQFFRASMDALKPGGLQAQVVSSFLMDAQDKSTRMALASKAKLVAAFRLPNTAFKENARTEVVTDIIILQRRTAEDQADAEDAVRWIVNPLSDANIRKDMDADGVARYHRLVAQYKDEMAWVLTEEVADPLGGDPIKVNAHFARNPKNIIGTMDRSGTMRTTGMMNVHLEDPTTLGARLNELVASLPQNVVSTEADVVDRTERAYKLLGEAMRIGAAQEEPGHMKFNDDGNLTRVIEREHGDGTIMQRQDITPDSPWSADLLMDSEGRWYKVEVKLDEQGNSVKVQKDGKATRLNEYTKVVYQTEAEIPSKMRLGELNHGRMKQLVNLRDLLKRQLTLETEDSAKGMMEGNRTRMAKAYKEYVDANGPINRRATASLTREMPDGGLVMALESSYEAARSAAQSKTSGLPVQDERVVPAPILSERVVPKYEPPTSASSPADALAISLADFGGVNIERVAALLGVTPEEAAASLTEGDTPLVFKDPETNEFETANAYLSGQVRRKLMAARSAGMSANVRALEAVQPERWGAENVAVQMGATWIPADVYADFAMHTMGGSAKVTFSPLTNTFALNLSNGDKPKMDQWKTEHVSGAYILNRLMNSQTPNVSLPDGEGKMRFNQEGTSLAALKGREFVTEFGDWIFRDGGRRERLVEIFNEKFNTRVSRQYDGSHLQLPGKVPDAMIKMRRHQMNAIWRGISSKFLLVDHVVGAGKTFTAIARSMERRRMGLARKPTIVVPNHLVEQWQADVYRLYPAAKVLAATKKDFEKKNRRRLLSRVATGDYDIVILPHSSFGFVGISPETELRYLEEEMATALKAVKEAEEQAEEDGHTGFRKPVGVKEAERLVSKIESRMAKLREGARDRLLTFEQLGIDDLTIDEAHEFKNLFYSSRLTKVRGMGDKIGSRKAADLYNKVRVLRDNNGAVTFMTGTPVSNSVVELYTMMRYLASSELKELGIEHFDAWRTQFVDASPAFEPNESGRLQEVTRLGRTWSNMRSLMDLYYGFTDAVTNEDIKTAYSEDNNGKEFPIPKVKGGERQLRKVAPTKAQEIVLKQVIEGFDGLPNIEDIQERNATRLRLMDRARKLSLDVRAAEPTSTSKEVGGKLEQIASEVKRIYDQWNDDLGTQLVFLDRSVPKSKSDSKVIKEYDELIAKRDKALTEDDDQAFREANEALEKFDAEEVRELRSAQNGGWNAYQQIKDNLVASGIPEGEIRFIQEANTDEQKQAIFDAVNGGKIRVLIGSTPRMGAGTNVQQRLVGLHHADVTWKPSDIEQREGRVIRQGNELLKKYGPTFEVEILAYATERTVDAKMWSLNSTKLKAINGLRKYTGDFTMELEDEESVSMAEMAALASGNPLLLERVVLESSIQELELQERSHRRKLYGAEDAVTSARQVIETAPARIEAMRKQAKALAAPIAALQKSAAARRVTVEGVSHDSYKDAMKAALAAVETQQGGNDRGRYSIDIDGKKITSKEKIDEAIGSTLGDVEEFEVAIGGQIFTQRTASGRKASEILSPLQEGALKVAARGDLGSMLGMPLKYQIDQARYNTSQVDLVLWLEMDGQTVATESIDSHDPFQTFTTGSLRDSLGALASQVDSKSDTTAANRLEQRLESAIERLPELEAKVGAPFNKADELSEKRDRLTEVVKELMAAPVADTESDESTEGNPDDEAHYGSRNKKTNTGTASDQVVMAMAGESKSADEILRFISNASKSPFNRQIARVLRRTKANPAVSIGGDMGGGEGFKFLAKYSRKNHEVTMSGGAAYKAEQIFLHETVHAATLMALDKGGPVAAQMQRLYESVKKQGGAADQYGMKNVGEFVAEAFTNPEFQKALKGMRAPGSSMWDRFVAMVRQVLGLPMASQDALSAALELGAEVMRENTAMRNAKGFEAENAPFADDIAHFGAADAMEQIKQFDVKSAPKNTWAHYRGMAMQALGRRQIVELYNDELPQLETYNDLVQEMDAQKNESGAEADGLAQAWGALDKKSGRPGEETRLADLMHDATLAQMDPDKPQEPGTLDIQYKNLKAKFEALSPEAQSLYRQARDMYMDHYSKVQKAIKDRVQRSEMSSGQKRQIMSKMDEDFFKKLKGVYFPLARFGQYVIVVKDANGEVKNVTRAESVNEATEARKELLKAFPPHMGNVVGKVLKQAEFNAGRDAVGKGFMADLMNVLDEKGLNDELRDTVAQLYLSSLPDLSWAKHGMHRKGTPGFSQDARRAFAQNMFHGARYLAKLNYADQLQDQLIEMQEHVKVYEGVDEYDSIQAQQVVDEMVKRHESMMSPDSSPISTALTSFGFLFHMGLSPASAMVNLTQTALVAFPQMAAKWGYAKTSKALIDASTETVKSGNDLGKVLKGDELAAYERAVKDGTIDVTMAHDLAGISQGEDQRVTWKIRPAMRAASFMFHHAEKFNRQATFIAAYRLAKSANPKMSEGQLYEAAKKATYDGHFDYASSNRARVLQGNWQKVIFLFKQYGQNMVYALARNAYLSVKGMDPAERKLARKTLGGILAMHASAAGVLGLPLVGPLLTLASFMGGDDDEPWDAEVAMQNLMADMLGKQAAEVMAHGLSRLTPFDISGRVALDKLILPDVQEGLEGKAWADSAMSAALGPVAGIGVNMARGMQKITDGKYQLGFEDMMPTALRGPMKAMRYAMDGAVDKSGVVITDEVNPAGVVGQALGLSPSQVRRDTERRSAIYGVDRTLMERRSVLTRMFAEASMAGDTDMVKDVREHIQAFNEKNPNRRITVPGLMQSIRNRQKRIDQSKEGVYLPTRRQDAIDMVRF